MGDTCSYNQKLGYYCGENPHKKNNTRTNFEEACSLVLDYKFGLWMKVVEVNLILTELFHIIVTTNLHFTCIHSLFFLGISTHLTLAFIQILVSWLFHIIKIFTSEYIVKNSRNKITIQFINIKFTQQFKHKNYYRSIYFSILLKIESKLQ